METLAPSAPLAGQIVSGTNFDIANLSYTPFLGQVFDPSSPSSQNERIGRDDERVRVGYARVWKKDETWIVFLISNKTAQAVQEVTTSVNVPEHYSFELAADPLVQCNPANTSFTLASLPAGKTVLEVVKLRHKKHGFNLALTAQVQYAYEGRKSAITDCNVIMEISDLLRPHPLTTDVFGKNWIAYPHEKKAKFTHSEPVGNTSSLLEKLKTNMMVHPVQVIGGEGIAVASLLQSPELLLVHALVLPNQVMSTSLSVISQH